MIGTNPVDKSADCLGLQLRISAIHVETHEMGNRGNDSLRETEATKHLRNEVGADVLMPIKVWPILGSWLTNVVEKCRKTRHEVADGSGITREEVMPIDVVRVPLILVNADSFEEFWPEVLEYAGLAQEFESHRGP